jgi:hypothetical protein
MTEEFNLMQKKKLEYIQYKLDYQENKRKWDRKIEALAGDGIERLRDLAESEENSQKKLSDLEL